MKRLSIALGSIPSLTLLFLIYSFAIRVYMFFGKWPKYDPYGTGSIPHSLTVHGDIAFAFFFGLLLITIFVSPVGIFISAYRNKGKRVNTFLITHVIAFVLSFVLIIFVPSGFLGWWFD